MSVQCISVFSQLSRAMKGLTVRDDHKFVAHSVAILKNGRFNSCFGIALCLITVHVNQWLKSVDFSALETLL